MAINDQIQMVQDQLAAAGASVGGAVEEASSRLSVLVEPALRLAFQQVLSEASTNLGRQLEGVARIELRLEEGEPVLIGIPVPAVVPDPSNDTMTTPFIQADSVPMEAGPDGPVTRFTLRIPDGLKERVDLAATAEGLSLNTWFVRAASRALSNAPIPTGRRSLSGWLA